MGKQIAVLSDADLPRLSARVERRTANEFRITVCHLREGSLCAPAELPRFTTFVDPTLYVRPQEAMNFVLSFAMDQLHNAATYLTGQGEYYAD